MPGGPIGVTFNSHSGDFAVFALSIDGTDIPLQPYSAQSGPRGLKITGPLSATVPSVPGIIHVPVVFDPFTELDAPGNHPDNPPTYIISGIGSGVAEFVFTPSVTPNRLDLSRYTYYLGSSASNLSTPEASAFIIWSLLGMTACVFKSSRPDEFGSLPNGSPQRVPGNELASGSTYATTAAARLRPCSPKKHY